MSTGAGNGKDRLPMFPSRMAHAMLDLKLASAKKGQKILSQQHELLNIRFGVELNKIIDTKKEMDKVMKEAFISLAHVRFTASGIITPLIEQNVSQATALYTIDIKHNMLKGTNINLPEYTILKRNLPDGDSNNMLGLGRGGTFLKKTKQKFGEAIQHLITLATMQTRFVQIDEEIKRVTRRENSIEKVIIPRIMNTARFVETELDEMDREDLYRMKKMVLLKHQRAEAEGL